MMMKMIVIMIILFDCIFLINRKEREKEREREKDRPPRFDSTQLQLQPQQLLRL